MDERRDTAAWDAEIDADFASVQAATKTKGRHKRGQRVAGAPLAFLTEVCRRTRGRAPLAVALLVYRRTVVCRSRTVTLPSAELVQLCVGRSTKNWAMRQLADAGLIRAEPGAPGRSATVTLLWRPEHPANG